jgi:phage RecT family recombinase
MENNLQLIKQGLLQKNTIQLFQDSIPSALGREGEKMASRFAKMAYTAVVNSPALQRCSLPSIIKAASMCASLGLDIDSRGLAYLVPYGGEAQFQIGYRGMIELAYRSGKVKSINAHCIYESERNTVKIERENGRFTVLHPFSFSPPSGGIIAVYATAEIEGLGAFTEVMRKDEIDKIRASSKAKNSPAWADHYDEMAKKTVIRRLSKFLPQSIVEDLTKAVVQEDDIIDVKTTSRFDPPQTEEPAALPSVPPRPQRKPEPVPEPADNIPFVTFEQKPQGGVDDTIVLQIEQWLSDNNAGVTSSQVKARCAHDAIAFGLYLLENDAKGLKNLVAKINGGGNE